MHAFVGFLAALALGGAVFNFANQHHRQIANAPPSTLNLEGTTPRVYTLDPVTHEETWEIPAGSLVDGVAGFAPEADSPVNESGCVGLFEHPSNGAENIILCAPANVTASTTLYLPGADGVAGHAMITDGAGTLNFGYPGGLENANGDKIELIPAKMEFYIQFGGDEYNIAELTIGGLALRSRDSPAATFAPSIRLFNLANDFWTGFHAPTNLPQTMPYILPRLEPQQGMMLTVDIANPSPSADLLEWKYPDEVWLDATKQTGMEVVSAGRIDFHVMGFDSVDITAAGLEVKGQTTFPAAVRFFDLDNTHYVQLQAGPMSAGTQRFLQLPVDEPSTVNPGSALIVQSGDSSASNDPWITGWAPSMASQFVDVVSLVLSDDGTTGSISSVVIEQRASSIAYHYKVAGTAVNAPVTAISNSIYFTYDFQVAGDSTFSAHFDVSVAPITEWYCSATNSGTAAHKTTVGAPLPTASTAVPGATGAVTGVLQSYQADGTTQVKNTNVHVRCYFVQATGDASLTAIP